VSPSIIVDNESSGKQMRTSEQPMTRCGNCGYPNVQGASFCASCNQFLQWSDGGATTQPAGSRPDPTTSPVRTDPIPDPTPLVTDPHAEPAGRRPRAVSSAETAQRSVERLIHAMDKGRTLALGRKRSDLAAHLDTTRARLDGRTMTAVVIGEFKAGKSTLVNALLQTAVCPVDADIVTAVPTSVMWGELAGLTAFRQARPDQEPVGYEADLDSITELVSEPGRSSEQGRLLSVEVRLPRRILQSGLRLLDTPGVGGLDSAHGQLTLATLATADCVLFVTAATQELTAPELDFLDTAVHRCPSAALVVTKIDLYPHWRRIVELDTAHLVHAGLNLPVFPVTSFLRLRATKQPELNAESGFAPLMSFLATAVVAPGTRRAATTLAHEVDFVATQLAHESDAERVVLSGPERSPDVLSKLVRARDKAVALAVPTANWQQRLTDGVSDLVADVEHDLHNRLRVVVRDVETVIDQGDPKDTWSDIEVWLRRQVAVCGVVNRDLLIARARQLSEDVAAEFTLEADAGVEVELANVTSDFEEVELVSAAKLSMPGGRLASLMVAARSSVFIPMILVSIIPGGLGIVGIAIAGAAVTLGAGIGTKIIRDERTRQRTYRQQQAKAAARKFVEEASFVMNKESRDALRKTQRQLRDNFQQRAALMHRSTTSALDAATRAARLDPAARTARADELAAETEQLRSIKSRLGELSGAARTR
jgi:GTPase SAR1 family protein